MGYSCLAFRTRAYRTSPSALPSVGPRRRVRLLRAAARCGPPVLSSTRSRVPEVPWAFLHAITRPACLRLRSTCKSAPHSRRLPLRKFPWSCCGQYVGPTFTATATGGTALLRRRRRRRIGTSRRTYTRSTCTASLRGRSVCAAGHAHDCLSCACVPPVEARMLRVVGRMLRGADCVACVLHANTLRVACCMLHATTRQHNDDGDTRERAECSGIRPKSDLQAGLQSHVPIHAGAPFPPARQ